MKEKISVCITAGNEQINIRRCLESVKWADEIVVVDSFSTDDTPVICREYTDLVYQHRWLGYIGQKNLIKDLASGTWILFIDADEEISPELKDEIINEFATGESDKYAGYEFPRMVWFMGKWIRHGDWYPDVKLRLFRKELGSCGGEEPHDKTTVNGPVKRLRNKLNHYTYNDISDQIATLNNFSMISARSMHNNGRRFKLIDLLTRPLYKFIKCYFIKHGFLDGMAGLKKEKNNAFGVFIKYAKLWEIGRSTQDHYTPK